MNSNTLDRNEQRAQDQYEVYTFRAVTICDQPGVYVYAPVVGGEQAIYTVDVKRRNCNCLQHQSRCKGTISRCKHVHMAERFLRETNAARMVASVPTRLEPAAEYARLRQGWR